MRRIDGPRLPARGGKTTGLVVFLHGYGADGEDLIDIGRSWQPHLPGVAFASPHAPDPCTMSPTGRQWFPLTMRDPSEYGRGVAGAKPVLDGFLDMERDRLGLTDDRIVLVGFSQGTMMALHAGLARPGLAGIVGYSGLLATPESLPGAKGRPRITLIHGDRDEVIPIGALFAATQALAAAGLAATFHICPGLGHGIDQRGLELGLLSIAEALGLPLSA